MLYVVNLLVSAIAVFIAAYIAPGVRIAGLGSALLVAILLGFLNATIGVILKLFTLPLNFLTLGVVRWIINVSMILLVDSIVSGFSTNGFRTAALFGFILAFIQSILNSKKKNSI